MPDERIPQRIDGAATRIAHLPKIPLDQRYELIQEVGRGGMGVVHRAHDRILDREVALKRLLISQDGESAGYSRDETIVIGVRFLREARITAQLDHPNIIPVYEISEPHDGDVFYTMKFVRGISLANRLREIAEDTTLTDETRLQERLRLIDPFMDCCQAVAYAHAKGVVHRDLKPDNIMLGKYGQSLVVDWGLAKVQGEPEDAALVNNKSGIIGGEVAKLNLTQHGSVVGTPAYLAPEQARGANDRVGPQSDIFSLGAILYEIVSGKTPIQGNSLRETLFKAATAEYLAMEQVCPDAPKELVAVIERTMAKEPADRWKSADEIADELANWRSGGQVSIYHYSSMELLKRFVKTNARTLIAASIIVLVAMGFIGWNMWQSSATFQAALDTRNSEMSALKTQSDALGPAALLVAAQKEIQNMASAQSDYDAKTPVKERGADSAGKGGVNADAMLAASALIDQRISLAQSPVGEQVVSLLSEAEATELRQTSRALRFAAARLKALQGSWGFAEELINVTPASDSERTQELAFVDEQRKILASQRRQRIHFILDDVKAGLGREGRARNAPLLDQYVFELVSYRDLQSVDLLAAQLNEFVPKLLQHREEFEATKEGKKLVDARYDT